MKKIIILLLCALPIFAEAQILKSAGIIYFNGVPNRTPSVGKESEVAVDVATGTIYVWDRTLSGWVAQGTGGSNLPPQTGQTGNFLRTDGSSAYWDAALTVEVDGSITNEIQDLSLSGNTLSLTGDASTVNLSAYLDNTDAQTLSTGSNSLAISNGNSVTVDTDPTNDIITSSTAGGDVSGTFSNLQIVSNAVGSAELASTTVSPAAYTLADITVDADGRITGAANGTEQDPEFSTWFSSVPNLDTDDTDDLTTATTFGGDVSGLYSNLQLAANSVGASEIAANAVGSSEIAADAVGTSEIADGSVGTDDLGAASVNASKLAQMGAASGQVMKWNGSAWAAANDDTGAGGGVTTFNGRSGAVVPAASDYDANQVDVTPTGGIAAADVQAALAELDSEKLSAEVDGSTTNEIELPTQTGQNGKFLTTDGTNPAWATALTSEVDGSVSNELQTISVATNTVTLSNSGGSFTIVGGGINTVGTAGTTITITGTEVDGSTTNEIELPSQTGNAGKYLKTDGSNVSWDTPAGGGGSLTVSDEGSNLTTAATSIDFVGAGVVAANSSGAVTVTVAGSEQIDEFTSAGTTTYNVPTWAKTLEIICIGGGGGGGSGRRGATSTVRAGGAGGGSGAWSNYTFSVSKIGSPSTLSVTVGAAGTGGTARTTDDTNGVAGGNAGESNVVAGGVTIVRATGGLAVKLVRLALPREVLAVFTALLVVPTEVMEVPQVGLV